MGNKEDNYLDDNYEKEAGINVVQHTMVEFFFGCLIN